MVFQISDSDKIILTHFLVEIWEKVSFGGISFFKANEYSQEKRAVNFWRILLQGDNSLS